LTGDYSKQKEAFKDKLQDISDKAERFHDKIADQQDEFRSNVADIKGKLADKRDEWKQKFQGH